MLVMATHRPIIFVHGYSDKGASWKKWEDILAGRLGIATADLRTVTYVSLNNEINIKDIAEGFDRALSVQGGLKAGREFDAIVHSTGMQVVRSWVRADPRRIVRLKRLIAFAPATFGSPLAKQGRSWLGAIFKSNKQPGPDFLNAGNVVLDNLEPASVFTWELAEDDILAGETRYDAGPDTPYVFVFCGTGTYQGVRELVDKPGTDGTVRRAGCGMSARKIEVDLTDQALMVRRKNPARAQSNAVSEADRIILSQWLYADIPVHLVGKPDGSDGVNHATILSDPPLELQDLVVSAFQQTENPSTAMVGYATWLKDADAAGRIQAMTQKFQQFIIHAVDERGDSVTDYNLQLFRVDETGAEERLTAFTAEVDVYDGDKSYRSFHVDITALLSGAGRNSPGLRVRLMADSGTDYVGYLGYGFEKLTDGPAIDGRAWDACLTFKGESLRKFDFFHPYTTTLIRLYIERQVLPSDRTLPPMLVKWDPPLIISI
jgi:pimeloyl-ACP methyl ester carboxylesterase